MRTLPQQVLDLLERLDAPPRLAAHLTLVHVAACTLIMRLAQRWPDLPYDRDAILIGAATHGIGKVVHRAELSGPGHAHEDAGPALLIQAGYSEVQARFARTHGCWVDDPGATLEDLLVALADTIWKGKRDQHLESTLVPRIAGLSAEEPWAVYMALDEILQSLAQDADARMAWQAGHPALDAENPDSISIRGGSTAYHGTAAASAAHHSGRVPVFVPQVVQKWSTRHCARQQMC